MENKGITYRIKGIEIVSKIMHPVPENGVGSKFVFDIHVETRVHTVTRTVLPVVAINIKGGEPEQEVASIKVSSIFEIEEFEKYILLQESGLYHVPAELDLALRPIAISTARGVMFSEFRGTYLHNAILPVVYLKQMNEDKDVEPSVK